MENVYFQARGWAKYSEEDIYSEGCQPESANYNFGKDIFVTDTVERLVRKCQDFCGSDSKEDLQFNSCDEIGRLDISIMEDSDATKASARQIEEWKQGNCRLWSSTYTFQIEKIQAEPVDLSILN